MQTPNKLSLPLPLTLTLIIFTLIHQALASSSHPNSPYCSGVGLKPPLSFLLCNSTKLFSHGDVLFQRLTVTRPPNEGREAEVPLRVVNRAPELCRECDMDGGNCSAPVMCLCHAKKCKERILNQSHRSTSRATTIIVLATVTWIMRIVMLV